MQASQFVQYLQELIRLHGDYELRIGSDDEGNSYVSPFMPQIGWVRNVDADEYVLDGGTIVTEETDLAEQWKEDFDEDRAPTEDELVEYIETNYTSVFVA